LPESAATARIAGAGAGKNPRRLRRFVERLALATAALIRILLHEGIAPIKASDFGAM
jgi:hypothetical protein